jgi:hypothetical protein
MNEIPLERRRAFLDELSSVTGRPLPSYEPIRAAPIFTSPDAKLTVNGCEPTPATPVLASQDRRLIANAYEPIAVNGKAPVAKGWNTRPSTIEAAAAERASHPGAKSTGLRTGRLVGVDIDIVPAEHVEAIKDLAAKLLGPIWFERVGAKGAMFCYRNETPIGKITVSGKHPMQPGKIEILGTGQQFVSYGIHPDTHKPYTWTNTLLDGEPLRAPLDKLSEVTPDKLRDFAEQAAAPLKTLGYTDAKVNGRGDAAEKVHLDAPVNIELDTPVNIERARTWLRALVERGDVAIEGQEGDSGTYQVACSLRDLGLSAKTAWEVLLEPDGWNEHCRPPWGRDELARKVRNAYKYGQNPPGAYAIDFSPGELVQPGAAEATTSPQADKLVERFRGRWPDEYEQLSELEFWDDDKTLPRCPDGCIAIVYGEFGTHKTNTILAMLFDAMLVADARVCYAAGEGAHGVGKQHSGALQSTRDHNKGSARAIPHRAGRSALCVSRGGQRVHRSAEGFPSGHCSARHVSDRDCRRGREQQQGRRIPHSERACGPDTRRVQRAGDSAGARARMRAKRSAGIRVSWTMPMWCCMSRQTKRLAPSRSSSRRCATAETASRSSSRYRRWGPQRCRSRRRSPRRSI